MIPASSFDKNVGQITRSRGKKVSQIFKMSLLHQFVSYSVDQKLKMKEIGLAI